MKTIREVLEKIWGWASCGLEMPERDYRKDEFLTQALSELKQIILESLPKEVNIKDVKSKPCPYSKKVKCCTMQDFTRNQALTDMKKRKKVYWKCPCGQKIYLEEVLYKNDAIDEDTGQLMGCSNDVGFLMTNIYCPKCVRVLILNFDVSRIKETVKDARGLDVKLPIPEK